MTALTSSELRVDEIGSEKKRYVVVYYSATGHTKKIAEDIAETLKCDLQEIFDVQKGDGTVNLIATLKDVGIKNLIALRDIRSSLKDYSVVIIGTPVVENTVSPPIKTFILKHRADFKKVAFFSTHDDPDTNPFKEMKYLCGKAPIATLFILKKNVDKNTYQDELIEFISKIIQL